jgi:polyisoprenoid-binding protein YceI
MMHWRLGIRMLLLAGLLAAVAATAQAEQRPFVFDRAHSQINFVADALLISAHGYFERFDGEIQIDRQDLENSSIRLVIEASSINTRNERRDNHLRSADFFDAANHPQITFTSTAIRRVDEKNVVITGELTIRGNTRTIEVPTQIVFLRDTGGRFRGQFQINRKEFGINYNSTMNPIDDLVTVQFDFHLVDQQAMEQRRQQQQQRQPGNPGL